MTDIIVLAGLGPATHEPRRMSCRFPADARPKSLPVARTGAGQHDILETALSEFIQAD